MLFDDTDFLLIYLIFLESQNFAIRDALIEERVGRFRLDGCLILISFQFHTNTKFCKKCQLDNIPNQCYQAQIGEIL